MEHRTIVCELSSDNELVELSFSRGRDFAVIYARENSGALVFERDGQLEGALVTRDITEVARALAEWANEQIHGTDAKVPS